MMQVTSRSNKKNFSTSEAPKKQFKKKVREILFAIFHAEDTYVETPTLLLKMTKYVK